MSITLREFQAAAIDALRTRALQRPVLVSPTGSGKTVMGAALVRGAVDRGRTVLWLAHRMELIDQAAAKLAAYGVPTGTIMAGRAEDRTRPVQVASIQTLVRRTFPPADVIVVDEAHHARATTYKRVLSAYPRAVVVGLTATPFRADGRGLGDVFGCLVVAALPDELIRDGFLLEPRVFAPPGPDVKGLRKRAGDWSADDLALLMDRPCLTGSVVDTWLKRANGRRTVVFATTVEHSQNLAATFAAAGVRSAHLDGDSPAPERARVLDSLRTGALSVVTNCLVLTEGWDLPALEVCVMARPTASLCLFLQMVGRIMRPEAGKADCVLLDHAGNVNRHGLPTDPLDYSLDDQVKRKPAEARTTKQCPGCFAVVKASADRCPYCGWEFGGNGRAPIVTKDGELTEYRREGPLMPGATPEEQQGQYAALLATAAERGYYPSWAGIRFQALFGTWPRGLAYMVARQQATCPHARWETAPTDTCPRCRFCGLREDQRVGPPALPPGPPL